MKIKKGDNIIVVTGADKGKKGKVLSIDRTRGRVVVEGVKIVKKHLKARGNTKGQTIEIPASVNISNVMFFDEKSKKGTRIGYSKVNNKKVRISKKSGQEI